MIRVHIEVLVVRYFPHGKRIGHEWVIGSIGGEAGNSLKIELEGELAGMWTDFATNEGGTFVDAVMQSRGMEFGPVVMDFAATTGTPLASLNGAGPDPADQYKGGSGGTSGGPGGPSTPTGGGPGPSAPGGALPIDWDREYKPHARQLDELAVWRCYSPEFCALAAKERWIGRAGPYWVFPVVLNGVIVAVHKRLDKDRWIYEPAGHKLQLFIIGDIFKAVAILVGESQWDVFAGLDAHRIQDGLPIAGIVTRGAKNAKLLKDLVFSGQLYAIGQNDQAGKDWLTDLGSVRSFKHIPVPPQYHDLNDWLKDGGHKEFMAAHNGAQAYQRVFPPEIVWGDEIERVHLPMPPSIIEGLLYRGEKLQIAAGSKIGKTWVMIDLGVCVAAGYSLWSFPTVITPVIYLNLELIRPAFEKRVRVIAAAHHIAVPKHFGVWHLRGTKLYDPPRWEALRNALLEVCRNGVGHPLIIVDPLYKLMGGKTSENSTGDVGALMEQLEEVVVLINGANASCHHFSKGNQSAKEAIDRPSGSGVFQRDPDTLLPITEGNLEGCFSVEPYARNHEPVKPFVVRWQHPLFIRDDSLNPKDLKGSKNRANAYIDPKGALKFITVLEVITRSEFLARMIAEDKNGRKFCGLSRAKEIIDELVIKGELIEDRSKRPFTYQKSP